LPGQLSRHRHHETFISWVVKFSRNIFEESKPINNEQNIKIFICFQVATILTVLYSDRPEVMFFTSRSMGSDQQCRCLSHWTSGLAKFGRNEKDGRCEFMGID
jgi:hypothetical protein